ncbi:MAG: hypothetical protein ABR507_01580 [Actinomycetota bacterium]
MATRQDPEVIAADRKSTGSEPPLDLSGRGGGNEWSRLTVAKDVITAHLIQGLLEDRGIQVLLDTKNDAPGAFLKPFGDPMAPTRVMVRRLDLPEASLVLMEIDGSNADETKTPMPNDSPPGGLSPRHSF